MEVPELPMVALAMALFVGVARLALPLASAAAAPARVIAPGGIA